MQRRRKKLQLVQLAEQDHFDSVIELHELERLLDLRFPRVSRLSILPPLRPVVRDDARPKRGAKD